MSERRPSDRRLGRAATIVVALVAVIIAVIFVTFNIAHYRTMQNQQDAESGSTQPG